LESWLGGSHAKVKISAWLIVLNIRIKKRIFNRISNGKKDLNLEFEKHIMSAPSGTDLPHQEQHPVRCISCPATLRPYPT
jgi:hypothetical protein